MLEDESIVNGRDSHGRTGLMVALLGGHNRIVKTILESPIIDLSIVDNSNSTALHYGCPDDLNANVNTDGI